MPVQADTLIAGATIITLDDERRVIRNGAVAFAGDRIVGVGALADLSGIAAREVIDGRGFVLTPGFVNGHVHITETLIRGLIPEALPFEEELGEWVIPLYKSMTAREQAVGAQLAVAAMLRTGTTTFLEAGTILALDEVAEAIAPSGIRARLGRWSEDRVWEPGADGAALTGAAVEALAADLARHPDDGRRIVAWPNLIGHMTATDALWQAAATMAQKTRTGICAHMSPVGDDAAWYLAHSGRRPIAHLAQLGVLSPAVNLVHMVHVDSDEVALVAASGASVTHCPGAAIRCGYGTTRHGLFPEMARAGVNIALGTDGADNHDMMRVMTLMAGLFKDAREDRSLFPAQEVLAMATLGGAKAAGLAGEVGALVPGMKADIVAHDIRRPEWQPVNDPVNQLVWSADGRGVHSVWVDGRRVVNGFACTLLNEAALYDEGQALANDIRRRHDAARSHVVPMA
ncbi:amidohydrolase family protein [Novosphingobium sp. 9]|uniref:amidohydrolase family protein n=1 Tax=Novosphingobium sp. 9 TaxID=2025349 RepID=UPI0021B53AFE|nr:amidohydrolase family protein [Novosphingobium sp. 9]